MQNQRIGGKPRCEHIASLGSVDINISVRERVAFWAKLPERLARLGNRVAANEHSKIYDALHARIPMATPEEQRAVQEETFKDDKQFFGALHDHSASAVEAQKFLLKDAEAKIAAATASMAITDELAELASARLAKLAQGESVAGGLGKPRDWVSALKEVGFTAEDLSRFRLYSRLTEAELETLLDDAHSKRHLKAHDRAYDRDVRRIIASRLKP